MRPRKAKRGDTVYEMRARKHGSQTPAPDQEVSLPNEAASTPTIDRLGIPLPAGTAVAFASLSVFEAVEKSHAQLAELVDLLAQSPGGGAFQ